MMANKRRRVLDEVDPLSPGFFRWGPFDHGYRIARAAVDTDASDPLGPESDVLIAQNFVCSAHTVPLANPEFFRELGNAPATPDGIVAFAKKHGWLGIGGRVYHLTEDGPIRSQWLGERLTDWRREIFAIRAAARVWDAIDNRDLPKLRRLVRRLGTLESNEFRGGCWIEYPEPHTWVLQARDDSDQVCWTRGLETVEPSLQFSLDYWGAAMELLIQEINPRIRDHCRSFLARADGDEVRPSIRVGPANLLGAAWWQLCRLVAGEVRYRPCRQCRGLIVIASRGAGSRADREFCSAGCKMKDHRLKLNAKKLKAAGRSVKQIAKELDTTTAAVERWLVSPK